MLVSTLHSTWQICHSTQGRKNMMKKTLGTLSLSMLLLAACGGNETSQSTPAQQQATPAPKTETATAAASAPAASKTYTVVTESSNPPYVSRNKEGQVEGFEYDLLQAIAEKKGIKLTFLPKTWNAMFESINTGNADIMTSNISITPERQQKYDFVTPHFESTSYALHKKGNKVATWKELANKKVGVQADTFQQELLNKYALKGTPYDSAWLGTKSVLGGEQDVFIADKGVILYYQSQYKNDIEASELPNDEGKTDSIGFAVKKGNTELRDVLDDGLKQIRADGTYDKIYAKWLGGAK